jgi:hypothetical protein
LLRLPLAKTCMNGSYSFRTMKFMYKEVPHSPCLRPQLRDPARARWQKSAQEEDVYPESDRVYSPCLSGLGISTLQGLL